MPHFSLDDTIAAIATPPGEGGIGIVKISGPQAIEILEQVFSPGGKQSHEKRAEAYAPRRLMWGHVRSPETGEIVDEALVVAMPAPSSYTRQDVVEIQSHGGIVAVQKILQLVLQAGARLSEPGEMTMRAFVNGRLDLAQAEAVLDIVQARTGAALRAASDQLAGNLSAQVRRTRTDLIDVLAYLEASIDFVEDEIPPQDIVGPLQQAATQLERLLLSAEQGIIYRHGIRAAIVGRPNVGKSSLLNTLLRGERAIVTAVPGTTRDTLEETINIKGIPVILVDTAGIRQAEGEVEQLGVARSRAALQRADLVLLVLDGSQALSQEDREIADLTGDKPGLVLVNKNDLPAAGQEAAARGVPTAGDILPHAPHLKISALAGTGIDELENAIQELVLGGRVIAADTPLVTNPRHQALLQQALSQVRSAMDNYRAGQGPDLLAIDVREAVDALGEITGETASEDLLEAIFSQFCVGK